MKPLLLIIDDDPKLNRLLTDFLAGFGFRVESAVTPGEGLKKLRRDKPALIILDVMLPEMNGFELCKQIRRDSSVPIIMLTARGDPMDRIIGLEIGADDYLPKPFEPRELVARIQAVLRRTAGASPGGIQTFGRLSLDTAQRKVFLDGKPVELTTHEFEALALLARHPGKVLNRDRVLQELRGMDSEAFNRSVDITMSRLRQKLGDDPKAPEFIKTIWGAGYMFIGG
ncbi:MAG: response regulator transcription factor [Desulfobacterales bacterium]|nr:response regulator transcription factor [Desulfobacterales bacterium]MBI5895219.1 response regulator transcription factor [Desulfobacterales bacterium]